MCLDGLKNGIVHRPLGRIDHGQAGEVADHPDWISVMDPVETLAMRSEELQRPLMVRGGVLVFVPEARPVNVSAEIIQSPRR